MITEQILQSIDNINEVSEASSYAVLESMCTLIEKEFTFEELCSPEIIQEGEVLDNVKKKSKKDKNRLITILKFLPRLFVELGKAIKKWFSDKDLGKKVKDAGNELAKGADINTKKARVAMVNKKNEGKFELYVDKNGKIKVKRDAKSRLATLAWLGATVDLMVNLFKGIKDEFNLQNPSKIRNFVDECEKILHMKSDKKFSEVADMGLDALGGLISHVSLGTGTIASLCLGAKTAVEKKLAIMDASGKETENTTTSDLSQLLSKLTLINGAIAAAGAAVGTFKHIAEYITPVVGKVEDELDVTREAGKNVREGWNTEEFKKAHPKKGDETEEEYIERIQKIYHKEHPIENFVGELNEEKDRLKEERARKEQEEYDKAAAEYKAKKKEVKESPTVFDKKKQEKEAKKNAKKNKDEK